MGIVGGEGARVVEGVGGEGVGGYEAGGFVDDGMGVSNLRMLGAFLGSERGCTFVPAECGIVDMMSDSFLYMCDWVPTVFILIQMSSFNCFFFHVPCRDIPRLYLRRDPNAGELIMSSGQTSIAWL